MKRFEFSQPTQSSVTRRLADRNSTDTARLTFQVPLLAVGGRLRESLRDFSRSKFEVRRLWPREERVVECSMLWICHFCKLYTDSLVESRSEAES